MYRCIIIDDEPHAIDELMAYTSLFPDLKVVNTFTASMAALKHILKIENVDLIYINIEMPKITGLELSKVIRHKTKKLVFTSNQSKYGYEAIKVDADDYLLKPYSLAEFEISINKLFQSMKAEQKNIHLDDFFFVKSKEDNLKLVNIDYADVIAVESKLNYVMIYTKKRQVLTYMSLTEILKIFENYPGFFRFHRSFIIAQRHVESIEGNSIRMINGKEINVGDLYRKEFSAFLNKKLLKTGIR